MPRQAPPPPSQWGATFGLIAFALILAVAVAVATSALYIYLKVPSFLAVILGLFGTGGALGTILITIVRPVASWLLGLLPGNFLSRFVAVLASDLTSLWNQAIQPVVAVAAGALLFLAVILPIVELPSLFDPYVHRSWQVTPISFGSWERRGPCGPSNGDYQVSASATTDAQGKPTPQFNPCFTDAYNFTNFIYETNMTVTEGDCGGLLFRAIEQQSQAYLFLLCPQSSSYGLYYSGGNFFISHLFVAPTCTAPNGATQCTLASSTAGAINRGTNLLAVVADGSALTIYVNSVLLTSVTDQHFTAGHIGVAADSLQSATTVIFSNMKVWTL